MTVDFKLTAILYVYSEVVYIKAYSPKKCREDCSLRIPLRGSRAVQREEYLRQGYSRKPRQKERMGNAQINGEFLLEIIEK